jgi:hypothetical protein
MKVDDWKTFNYFVKYGNKKPTPKSTYWIVKYGNKVLTNPMPYSGCQIELKAFKMQGKLFPDKTKFKIVSV